MTSASPLALPPPSMWSWRWPTSARRSRLPDATSARPPSPRRSPKRSTPALLGRSARLPQHGWPALDGECRAALPLSRFGGGTGILAGAQSAYGRTPRRATRSKASSSQDSSARLHARLRGVRGGVGAHRGARRRMAHPGIHTQIRDQVGREPVPRRTRSPTTQTGDGSRPTSTTVKSAAGPERRRSVRARGEPAVGLPRRQRRRRRIRHQGPAVVVRVGSRPGSRVAAGELSRRSRIDAA